MGGVMEKMEKGCGIMNMVTLLMSSTTNSQFHRNTSNTYLERDAIFNQQCNLLIKGPNVSFKCKVFLT